MLTELDAINLMLRAIGMSPVTTTGLQHPHAITAKDLLDDVIIEVQSKRWWFNYDMDVTVAPSVPDGFINVPSNTINANPAKKNASSYPTSFLVQRGTRMYDPYAQTFVFTEAVDLDLHIQLDYTDLPYIAQLYIAHRAAAEYHSDVIGDTNKMQRLELRMENSRQELNAQHINNLSINAQTSPGAATMLGRIRPSTR